MSGPGAIFGISDVEGRSAVDADADVVIVGSGAAGATVARVLSGAGVDVIVLEEGAELTLEERRLEVYHGLKRFWRDGGMQTAGGRGFMPILQGVCVGGTTVINGAIIHRIPPPILDLWCAEHGAGELLSPAEMERVFDTLDAELSVAPTAEHVRGRNNTLMQAGCDALGMKSNPIARNVAGCEGTARCLQGCPGGRKQSMERTFVPAALADGARLYASCRVEGVELEGGRAVAVRGRFRDPVTGRLGPPLRARARRAVVLAASAIQTPVLLARSGIRARLLGRRFQAHPGTAMLAVFGEPVRMWYGATQGHESTHYWDERMKFESLALPPELGAVRLPGLGAELMEQLADYERVAIWGIQVRARTHGRVRPSRLPGGGTSIRYAMVDEDLRTVKLALRRLGRMMFAAGAERVLPGVHGLPDAISSPDELAALDELPDDPRLFHFIAAHLFGTAVMGPEPATSVVAPDGAVHGVRDLYVADSSVFPTNMGVNPQHTICAVAWRIAERLADRLAG